MCSGEIWFWKSSFGSSSSSSIRDLKVSRKERKKNPKSYFFFCYGFSLMKDQWFKSKNWTKFKVLLTKKMIFVRNAIEIWWVSPLKLCILTWWELWFDEEERGVGGGGGGGGGCSGSVWLVRKEKMFKSLVYRGVELLGEVEIYPEENNSNNHNNKKIIDELKEIRISHFSQPSERCPPLAVLHTITSCGVCFKMESKTSQSQDSPLFLLHSSCVMENKV